ncbi:hypothetical protein AOQ84DRAFT_356242 [Glonium stellatum]|uniref:Uncharacterized protein n=1 Tax=Glonium stellatum TaxID=574774 RepID=A0A8E2EU10_9PEZI|nr:hypothetical protein AOQ84DRAFT_356242 [Glonium stellatum]
MSGDISQFVVQVTWGNKVIADRNVLAKVLQAITGDGTIQVTIENFGPDPAPGVLKTCIIKFRTVANGPVFRVSGQDFSWLDFRSQNPWDRRDQPQIVSITYGKVNIPNPDVMERFFNAMINTSYVDINNNNMGGDPLPGVLKTCTLDYRMVNDGPLLRISANEGERIDFRKHILRITYQNKILYNKPEAYERYNRALMDYFKDPKATLTINNQALGGDPAVGVVKNCQIGLVFYDTLGVVTPQLMNLKEYQLFPLWVGSA